MSKTQIAILWGFTLVIVLAFVVAGQFLSRSTATEMPVTQSTRVYSLPQVPYSARGFYDRAWQAALSWQSDAQLASAAAYWPFVRLDHLSQPTTWTFQFFSPATQHIYVIAVDERNINVIRSSLTPYPLTTLRIEQWQIDSPEALNTWLNHGGGRFLELHPAVDVLARLVAGNENIEWVIAGNVSGTDEVYVVRLNATTGQVSE